jgi:hypothetical protein
MIYPPFHPALPGLFQGNLAPNDLDWYQQLGTIPGGDALLVRVDGVLSGVNSSPFEDAADSYALAAYGPARFPEDAFLWRVWAREQVRAHMASCLPHLDRRLDPTGLLQDLLCGGASLDTRPISRRILAQSISSGNEPVRLVYNLCTMSGGDLPELEPFLQLVRRWGHALQAPQGVTLFVTTGLILSWIHRHQWRRFREQERI